MRIALGGALFVWNIVMRLSTDSARIKNTIPNMIAIQEIDRTAFDLFIFYSFFCASAFRIFWIEPQLTLRAVQHQGYCAGVSIKSKQNSRAYREQFHAPNSGNKSLHNPSGTHDCLTDICAGFRRFAQFCSQELSDRRKRP